MSWVQSHRNRVWYDRMKPNVLPRSNRISKPTTLAHTHTQHQTVRWMHYGNCHILEWQSETNKCSKHIFAHIQSIHCCFFKKKMRWEAVIQNRKTKKQLLLVKYVVARIRLWRHVHSTIHYLTCSFFPHLSFSLSVSLSLSSDQMMPFFSLNIILICFRMTNIRRRKRRRENTEKMAILAFIVHHSRCTYGFCYLFLIRVDTYTIVRVRYVWT